MQDKEQGWINFSQEPPAQEGPYEWRVPSVAVPGMAVVVLAMLEPRKLLGREILSPSFDALAGGKSNVPEGLQWRALAHDYEPLKLYEKRLLGVEGLEILPCPYCRQVPHLHAVHRLRNGNTLVGGRPQHLNVWWFECCEWSKTPHWNDPRDIERARRAALQGGDAA